MSVALALAFAATAAVYSLAGFAGGSTYLALLTLFGVAYPLIAPTALLCNLVASGGNSMRYLRAGLWRPRLLLPHLLPAIPMAYLGGTTAIGKLPFEWLTACSLLIAGGQLLWRHRHYDDHSEHMPPPVPVAIAAGAGLGYLSGLIGIGGGIFLAPLLYFLKAGTPREIAATCSFFIFVNSFAGLAGQWRKAGHIELPPQLWVLPVAVLIGSQIGSRITLVRLAPRHVALLTSLLLLTVAGELFHSLSQ